MSADTGLARCAVSIGALRNRTPGVRNRATAVAGHRALARKRLIF
jgi:hypothetical protein